METKNGDDSTNKFEGDGVVFKGKLLGIDPVSGPRGDKMCQQAMQRLKAIAKKAKGTHKERINISISTNGIKITNEKTNEVISDQKIPLISYISRDASDTRSFGYVYGAPETGHQFIGIKVEKSAVPVMKTIGELFKYVYEKRKQEKSDFNDDNSFAESNVGQVYASGNKETHEEKSTDIIQSRKETEKFKKESVADRYESWEVFNDDDNEKLKLNSGMQNKTLKKSNSEFPTLPLPLSPKRTRSKRSTTGSESPFGLTSSTEFDNDSLAFESSLSDVMFTALSTTTTTTTSATTTSSNVDRYAAFNEIHTLPSLFDALSMPSNEAPSSAEIDLNSSSVSSPDLWNKNLESSQSSLTNANMFTSMSSLTSPSAPAKPSRSPNLMENQTVFADLDPLGTFNVEQYFDKSVFFQPKKKCLKDLDNTSFKSLDSSLNGEKLSSTDPFANSNDKAVCISNSAFVSVSSSPSPQLTEGRPSSSASVVSRNPFVSETSSESSYDLSNNDCVFASPIQQKSVNAANPLSKVNFNNEISGREVQENATFTATIRKPLSPFNPFSEIPPQPPPRPPPRDSTPTQSPPPIPPRPSPNNNANSIPPPPLPKRKPTVVPSSTPNQVFSQASQSVARSDSNPFAPALPSPLRKTKQRTQMMMNRSNTLPVKKFNDTKEAFDPFDTNFFDSKLSQFVSKPINPPFEERIPLVTLNSNQAQSSQSVNGNRFEIGSTLVNERYGPAPKCLTKSLCEQPVQSPNSANKSSETMHSKIASNNSFSNRKTSENSSNLNDDQISPPERNIFKGNSIDPFANDEFFN